MPFWDTLLKIGGAAAAPFTGGLSMLPSLAATGYQIGSSLFNRGGGGGSGGSGGSAPQGLTPEERAFLDSLSRSAGESGARAEEFYGRGGALFDMATPAFGRSADFWSSILSGSDSDLMKTLGPEADAIARSYTTARRNIMATSPRGGGRDFALSQGRFNQAGDVGRLIATARPAAAKELGQIGTQIANAGASAAGIGGNAAAIQGQSLGTAANVVTGAQTTRRGQDIYGDLERQRQSDERQRSVGSGLASLISTLFPSVGGGRNITQVGGDLPVNLPQNIIRNLPNTPIPRYAHGGVVTEPTLAMVGEEGPEAIVPLTGGGEGEGSASFAQPGGPDIRAVAEALHKATGLTGQALARLVQMWLMKMQAQRGGQGEAA